MSDGEANIRRRKEERVTQAKRKQRRADGVGV